MAALTYTEIKLSGIEPSYGAADVAGDTLPANERGFLVVRNLDAAPITVTVVTPGNTEFGVAQPDVVITVDAGDTRWIGPFPHTLVNSTDKAVRVNYSAVTSVTRGAFYLG